MLMTTTNSASYRLGLDLGTNSIGWAAVRLDDAGAPCGVLDMGVRIFSDGRNPKDGSSLAVQRRIPRGQRRRRDRYLKRRADLLDGLTACALMPSDEGARRVVTQIDPYALRSRALDHPLTPFELGRAIFHLSQRRGFKSNRKADADDTESGATKEAMRALEDRMAADDLRTLGEFLAHERGAGRSTRFRNLGAGATAQYEFYPTRQMLEDEFDQIRAAQVPHHTLRPDQWDSLKDIIFYQRPLKPVDPGWCLLEAGEQRAARALPLAQEFRMLQEINNLRVRISLEPERPLKAEERTRVLQRLRSGKDIALRKGRDDQPATPTRDLGLPSGAILNLARGDRKAIKGDETAVRLMTKKEKGKKALELFGDRWLKLPLGERNDIVRFLLDTEDPEAVRRKALDDWGLNDAQATACSEVALPSGYANLSERAIRKLLPHLESGLIYSEAVLAADYRHHSDFRNAQAHERLPYYGAVLERDVVGADTTKDPEKDGEPARYGRFPNPTVHIGLSQLRRVVNRLIEVHGKPQEIVIELARDLKANREQKQRYQQQQKEGEERNQGFKEMIESAGEEVTPYVLRKLRLWEEQGPPQARVCPYSGSPISFGMAVSSQTEIDHILPFSQTLNNSMANKVVCTRQANQYKGDRSPWEAFGHNPPGYDYDAIRARAPENKRWRFEPDAMEQFEKDRDFLDRQLNETRYLSRTARTYLAHLYDEKTDGQRVRAIPGLMSALLRRGWGLEGMLRADPATDEIVRKQRDDHRHHAIDAFVVACTSQGLLQQFARAAGSDLRAEERLEAVAGQARPWDGFDRNQLRPSLDRLAVSHKPDHGTRGQAGKTTGQLHKATAYGIIKSDDDGKSKVVVRKQLATGANGWPKTRKDLETVRDESLQAALLKLWDTEGGKPANFVKRTNEGVWLNGRCQRVRRVRVVQNLRVVPIRPKNDIAGKPYKGYKSDSNEFADIWKHNERWKIVVVPTFDANQPEFDLNRFRPHPAAKRLMRLHKNDMGALGEGPERRIVRVRKCDAKTIVLDDHNEADMDGRERKGEMDRNKNIYSATRLRKEGFRKISVDEIGRVRDPGPWQS